MNGHNEEAVDTEGSQTGSHGRAVRMKRQGAGAMLFLGFASFLLVTVGGTRILNHAVQGAVPHLKPLEGADVYAAYDKADDLLLQGRAREAGQILDRTRPENLVVEGGATGEGALADRSSMTLLMQLVKKIGQQAVRAAQAGDKEQARTWLVRGWRIGDQAIASPRPSVNALTVAHVTDCHLSQVQAQVARLCGNVTDEKLAVARNAHLMDVWLRLITPQIHKDQVDIASTEIADRVDTARLRHLCDRYSLYRMQAGAGAGAQQV